MKKKYNDSDEAFENFVGQVAYEDDGGWTKEVWDAAWSAARDGVSSNEEGMVTIDDQSSAIIGKCYCWDGQSRVERFVYSGEKLIDNFVENDGMSEEEALEWVEYNIEGAYWGPTTPIIVWSNDE
tara:strand:- start:157 stop:531 length:375 start_codon:yes stop_codon:yes gene_type:complete